MASYIETNSDLAESMINFIIDKNYYYQVTWYSTWVEFHKFMFDKTMSEPNLAPEQMRKLFLTEVLPYLENLNLTLENRIAWITHFKNVPHLEQSNKGYKLKPKSTSIISNNEDDIQLEICRIREEFENISKPVILLDWKIFEELVQSICYDKKYRFYLSLIVQTEEELLNRIEIPIVECIRRILRIITTYNETNELPSIFNNLPNFENIIKYQELIKWIADLSKKFAKNTRI